MACFFKHLILALILAMFLFTVSILADVPGTMNYQGCLTDNLGNPVVDIPHNITFKIYDESNTVLWEESHTISTYDGLFTVQLGSNGSPLNVEIFNNTECWIGITVDSDPEIIPRSKFNTVPFAFKTGKVNSHDIINEPGVAAFSGAYYVYLDNQAYTVLCSLTIDCPADGFVMAIAHGRIATLPEHTAGINSYATVGISDNSTSLPGNQDLDFHIDSAAPSGTYSVPFGMTSMFEVATAGSYTYYYLAYEFSGSVTVADMQFNLVYFPTAYGTVDPVPPPVSLRAGMDPLRFDGLIQFDNDPKPNANDQFNIDQLEKELAEMKTKIELLQQQIEILRNE